MQPVIPDFGSVASVNVVQAGVGLLGSLVIGLIIAWVYRATHRGLSYSQSFQFALVLLCMLGSTIMQIAASNIVLALGLLGAFSIVRFRTAVKDPKDMAYVLLVLTTGLAMGAGLYAIAVLTTVVVCLTISVLTWMNFGLTNKYEAVLRIFAKAEGKGAANAAAIEAQLSRLTSSYRLLSAHARGDRMEFSYGVRPRGNETAVHVLEAIRKSDGVEDAEVFDAKHQLEF